MKSLHILRFLLVGILLVVSQVSFSQKTAKPITWTQDQLMEPAQLAQAIQANKNVPLIISVGPGAVIPNSVEIGPSQEAANLDSLKKELTAVKKDAAVVIYCGCCPFEHCPNVRPAIALLNEMKFTNFKLLNIPNNIKTDWLDKGYPVAR